LITNIDCSLAVRLYDAFMYWTLVFAWFTSWYDNRCIEYCIV